ncbi:unnamed protein product [Rotaria sp. Silwood2]|nr:unnamed protein product [Rotaria sp. Silwood2]CAF4313612.1 unnamed protein product [Rotaria sp. Silwood2]
MAHINTRILDAGEERLNTLTPLRGYASKSLVSLQEAVVKLRELVDDVDSRVWTATSRSENPANELSQDESAAIVLYTIEWDPDHPSSGAEKPNYEQLQSKLEQVNNENERLKVRCNEQQAQIDELETANKALNKNCANYDDEIQRLKQDNRRLKQEAQQYNQKIVHLSDEIPKHKEEIQRIKQDNRRLTQEAQKYDQERQSLNDKIQRLEQEIERLKRPSASSSGRTKLSFVASSESPRIPVATFAMTTRE